MPFHSGIVPRRTLCCVCREHARRKGQRTCKGCHADLMKRYRTDLKTYIQQLEDRVYGRAV